MLRRAAVLACAPIGAMAQVAPPPAEPALAPPMAELAREALQAPTPAPAPVPAQAPSQAVPQPPARLTLDLSVTATATDNGNAAPPGGERADLVLRARPRIAIARKGAGLDYTLDAAGTAIGHARGTQPNEVLPDVRASARATVVERSVFLEAEARVQQTEIDPFGARADAASLNRRTGYTLRLSPVLDYRFGNDTVLSARHDLAYSTREAGPQREPLRTQQTVARFSHEPRPHGASLEWTRLDGELFDTTTPSRATLTALRLGTSLSIDGEWIVGAVVGQERNRLPLGDTRDPLYGLTLQWQPSSRTRLDGRLERRFFGLGGALSMTHRMPLGSFSLTMSREPVLATASLGPIGTGGDLRGFLDAILTTRYPDPTKRSGLVDTIVSQRGLDTRTPGAADLQSQYPQLSSAFAFTGVLLGTRNTLALTVYRRSLRRLVREDDPLGGALGGQDDARQVGGSLQYARRLGPQLSADAVLQWSRVTGLAARRGEQSNDRRARLSLTLQLSPRTTAFTAIQRSQFDSNARGQQAYRATDLIVGVSHQF
jgi:uncharacterized protein (PEP-CTERM system associated)